ncbi:acyl-CoA thioesterase [Chloroflexota bacterium]
MEGKRAEESRVEIAQLMMPQDANPSGNVHGGAIMRLVDNAAALAAIRHARKNVVTASIDHLDFLTPVYIGDLVNLKASLNMAGTTSMEVGVRVEAENPQTGKVRHVASAYLTLVALNEKRLPTSVPPLILETEGEIRRSREAVARRQMRFTQKHRE